MYLLLRFETRGILLPAGTNLGVLPWLTAYGGHRLNLGDPLGDSNTSDMTFITCHRLPKGFIIGMLVKGLRIFLKQKYKEGGLKQRLQDGNRE
jgi:hypothetical protein